MDRVNNEWVLKECSLKENPIGQCERSVLHWFGQIERMSMDRRSLNSWYLLHIIETKQNQQGEKAAKYKDGAGDASSSSKNMYSLKSNVMKTHVQEVTQMLPGGLNVLGFFFMGSVDVFEDREFPLNKLLMDFRNELSCKPIMYGGDPASEILVYFKNSQTGKIPNSYLSPMQDDNEQEGLKTVSAEAELWFKGSVVSQVIIHSDAVVKEAEEAVKSDILRTLSRRLDMHWHSLVEEDINSFEGEKMVHEPPRRVLFPLCDNSITFSDHLFPGEDVEENVDLINSTFNVHLNIADVQEDLEQHDKTQTFTLKVKLVESIVCLTLTSDSPFEVKAGYKENVPDSHFEGYEYHWSKSEKPLSVHPTGIKPRYAHLWRLVQHEGSALDHAAIEAVVFVTRTSADRGAAIQRKQLPKYLSRRSPASHLPSSSNTWFPLFSRTFTKRSLAALPQHRTLLLTTDVAR
uniref:Uncharacterized protein n=1 Tax=Timema bartmani TaxID=61472 RepID=A0A7R9EVH1_9NEOP|nr:unnamed protein product [Timema bartmani]